MVGANELAASGNFYDLDLSSLGMVTGKINNNARYF